jgi:hypothetical protein
MSEISVIWVLHLSGEKVKRAIWSENFLGSGRMMILSNADDAFCTLERSEVPDRYIDT